MKRFLIPAVMLFMLLFSLGLLGLGYLGVAPMKLVDAARLGAGISAKLACSGYHLSGFDMERIRGDLMVTSPATRFIDVRQGSPKVFTASAFGYSAAAKYYPGLGCTLQYPNMAKLERLEVASPPRSSGAWPQGEQVGEPDPAVQVLLQDILAEDEALGLDTRALLLVRDGEIAGEVYGPGIGPDTALLGWSMTKTVTAMLLARMEALGYLDVNERDLFPAWRADERREISLENMLQMTSGLEFFEPYVPGSDSTRMLFTEPDAAAVALASPAEYSPGEHFYYSSGNTNLLMRLARDRLGGSSQALLDFFVEELAGPLGLRNATLEMDPAGVFIGSSFMWAPARDWARLGLLLLNGGKLDGEAFLPPGWVERATAPNGSANDPRYGYQVWLNGGGTELRAPDFEPDMYMMSGHNGQAVIVMPGSNAVLVRLGWSEDYPVNYRLAPVQRLLAEAPRG